MPKPSLLLGLFPYFGPESVGGVQASSRVAWTGLGDAVGPEVTLRLLSYGAPLPAVDRQSGAVAVATRRQAVAAALGRRWGARRALVWHLDLLKLAPLFRIPPSRCALFLHGIEAWRPQDLLTRLLLARVGLVLTNSHYTWERVCEVMPWMRGRPQRTVHLGLGAPLPRRAPRPDDTPAAVIVGRLARGEAYKGHLELILAWPRVLSRLPNAQLWVLGDGDQRPDLEQLACEMGLDQSVRFFGQVPEGQKLHLLARGRCLAMPSAGEGFGLVYLEAMRLGRPCLVSTLDAGREVVSPPAAGLAVHPRDLNGLTAALVRLLSPGPEWERWSIQARERYEGLFTARHFQRRLIEALSPADAAVETLSRP